MYIKLLLLGVLCVISSAERYDDYALYKVLPESDDHLEFLKNLQANNNELRFWTSPTRVGEAVSVVSPPELRSEFEHSLVKRSISSEMILENIQEAFDAQVHSRRRRDTNRQLLWDAYQSLDDINEWFDYLTENFGDIVTIFTTGQSHEGRDIKGIKISRGSGRKAFFLQGGEIGADWLSPVVLTYIADKLIRSEDSEVRAASQDFDWYILPVLNPDGFVYTDEYDRLWVKNRRQVGINAFGVDLTKNWNSQWGVNGASFSGADNNFAGLGPFSEPETRSVSRYIESISTDLVGLLSFRAFGEKLLIPFAHTTSPMYNYNDMITIGRRAMGSLAVKHNTRYNVDTSSAIHDGATGSIGDWAKHRFYPTIVATYLLRDVGFWGYLLPVAQVEPSCEETLDSIVAIIREARFINAL